MTSNGNVREQITVALLGSTGSIGTQTIDVVASEAERFRITALAAGSDVIALAKQAAEIRPDVVVVADASRARELSDLVPAGIAVEAGADAMAAVAASADVAVNAVVGFAGLPVTMATLAAGKRLALANKESLIAAGPVVRTVRDIPGAEIVPVDSEHCAVHQCLRAGEGTRRLSHIVLTASGGPFRGRNAADLAQVTREVMRPQDLLARYGGEEFVLLLPDTNVESGVAAMTRLQRELTTRFFLQGSEKILITFSAGVAQLHDSETSMDALQRADKSMYLAKRSGKNRVMAA